MAKDRCCWSTGGKFKCHVLAHLGGVFRLQHAVLAQSALVLRRYVARFVQESDVPFLTAGHRRRSLALGVDEVELDSAFADSIRLAAILADRKPFVAL